MSNAALSRLEHGLSFAMRFLQFLAKSCVVLCLGLLLSIGLLNLAQGLFRAVYYFGFSKKPELYPVDLSILYWGLKFLALYLVSIFLLSRYRSRKMNQTIIKRSAIFGLVLGIFLIGAIALDRFIVQYYGNQIDCELPDPASQNLRPEDATNSK